MLRAAHTTLAPSAGGVDSTTTPTIATPKGSTTMSTTVNAFHVAPAGYTRESVAMRPHGCARHDAYTILCPDCGYMEFRTSWTLGADNSDGSRLVALVLDEDGDVYDVIDSDTWPDAASTAAQNGTLVVLDEPGVLEMPPVIAAVYEARVREDCFALTLADLAPSLAA